MGAVTWEGDCVRIVVRVDCGRASERWALGTVQLSIVTRTSGLGGGWYRIQHTLSTAERIVRKSFSLIPFLQTMQLRAEERGVDISHPWKAHQFLRNRGCG